MELQTSLALLDGPRPTYELDAKDGKEKEDKYGRTPFAHPALDKVNNMAPHVKDEVLQKQRLAQLAESYGIGDVIRWKPKQVGVAVFGSLKGYVHTHDCNLGAKLARLRRRHGLSAHFVCDCWSGRPPEGWGDCEPDCATPNIESTWHPIRHVEPVMAIGNTQWLT